MNREFKLLIDGHWKTSAQPVEIRSPFNGDVAGVTWLAAPGDVESAITGGVKDSGLGREGVRYAIEEMTEQKVLVFR